MIDIRKIPSYCINLDKRPERYAVFSKQSGIKDLRLERISAVDGSVIQIVNNPQISNQTKINILHKTRRSHGEINTPGAIGCSLSHYAVWKKFLETDSQFCLVLEDDAQIKTGLAEDILQLGPLPPFDVWCLSYKLYDKTLLPYGSYEQVGCKPLATGGETWKSPVNFWGTSSYILSRKGAERLIEGFFPIECHLDKYMCLKSLLGKLRLVVNTQLKTYTLSVGTDIQLHKCDLCNYPDTFNQGILVKKYVIAAPIIYGLIVTLLFGITR